MSSTAFEIDDPSGGVRIAGVVGAPDSTEGQLLTSTGPATPAVWADAGGGGLPVAVLDSQARSLAPGVILSADVQFPLPFNPDGTVGEYQYNPSVPSIVYAAGGVASFTFFRIDGVDTRQNGYTINASMIVYNADLTEILVVLGEQTADGGMQADSADITAADMAVDGSSVGDDLTYDAGTGVVTSAGGGTYTVIYGYVGNWND